MRGPTLKVVMLEPTGIQLIGSVIILQQQLVLWKKVKSGLALICQLWAKSQHDPGTVLSTVWCHVQDTVIGGKRRDAVFRDWSTLWCFYYSKLDRSQILVWITGCIWFIAESEN